MTTKVFLSHLNIANQRQIHPLYMELLKNPPSGVVYTNKDQFIGTSNELVMQQSPFHRLAFSVMRGVRNALSLPTVWYRRDIEGSLIHSNEHLLISRLPWVVDYEIGDAFTGFDSRKFLRSSTRSILSRFLGGQHCRRILPWSEAAKRSLLQHVKDPRLEEKTEVIYPAVALPDIKRQKKKGDKINVLFAAKNFYRKGGMEALEAFRQVQERIDDIKLTIVSETPEEIKRRVWKGVTFISKIPREQLYREHFSKADIFLYPTFSDTFGLVLLEAQAFGIPCITLKDFATPEIIDHGKTGLVVDSYRDRLIDDQGLHVVENEDIDLLRRKQRREFKQVTARLASALHQLVDDTRLRKRMGTNARNEVEHGKFSIKFRNKQLGRIYEEALHR